LGFVFLVLALGMAGGAWKLYDEDGPAPLLAVGGGLAIGGAVLLLLVVVIKGGIGAATGALARSLESSYATVVEKFFDSVISGGFKFAFILAVGSLVVGAGLAYYAHSQSESPALGPPPAGSGDAAGAAWPLSVAPNETIELVGGQQDAHRPSRLLGDDHRTLAVLKIQEDLAGACFQLRDADPIRGLAAGLARDVGVQGVSVGGCPLAHGGPPRCPWPHRQRCKAGARLGLCDFSGLWRPRGGARRRPARIAEVGPMVATSGRLPRQVDQPIGGDGPRKCNPGKGGAPGTGVALGGREAS
jgi:hypothetical protein